MSNERLPKRMVVCSLMKGSRADGGPKARWNDIVVRDLKLCGLADDWHILAQNRNEWRSFIRQQVRVMNNRAEQEEKQRKDVRKQRREERLANDVVALQCDHPSCVFTAVNRAGLVNHKRQRHIQP